MNSERQRLWNKVVKRARCISAGVWMFLDEVEPAHTELWRLRRWQEKHGRLPSIRRMKAAMAVYGRIPMEVLNKMEARDLEAGCKLLDAQNARKHAARYCQGHRLSATADGARRVSGEIERAEMPEGGKVTVAFMDGAAKSGVLKTVLGLAQLIERAPGESLSATSFPIVKSKKAAQRGKN